MTKIANLLFEVRMLKELNRSGYAFLGMGRESVAEHSFTTAFICLAMSRLVPGTDTGRLLAMALVHDIPEARTGDHNYVNKKYNQTDEAGALAHLTRDLPFGEDLTSLLVEFNQGKTLEAMLANDADQLSFIMELKKIKDCGAATPDDWLPHVMGRLKTEIGRELAAEIMATRWDAWWMHDYSE